ncbi:unnamed protein product [Bursaphelenchus okinawaensis]|uniref:Uncharacterized protein n=1 Tax=Bursaphelenchus okinawaensis TaxID=465554 RepID=A0A811L618_9BILA|nr:unnamed protein product [Bursaphelenchus okinawaensis]CAG9120064.1 unnamed protein product [Bursaphelenchus okinawaensis]
MSSKFDSTGFSKELEHYFGKSVFGNKEIETEKPDEKETKETVPTCLTTKTLDDKELEHYFGNLSKNTEAEKPKATIEGDKGLEYYFGKCGKESETAKASAAAEVKDLEYYFGKCGKETESAKASAEVKDLEYYFGKCVFGDKETETKKPEVKQVKKPVSVLVPVHLSFSTTHTMDSKEVVVQCEEGVKLYKVLHSIVENQPPFDFRYRVVAVLNTRPNMKGASTNVDWRKKHVHKGDGYDVIVKKLFTPKVNPVQEDLTAVLHVSLDVDSKKE